MKDWTLTSDDLTTIARRNNVAIVTEDGMHRTDPDAVFGWESVPTWWLIEHWIESNLASLADDYLVERAGDGWSQVTYACHQTDRDDEIKAVIESADMSDEEAERCRDEYLAEPLDEYLLAQHEVMHADDEEELRRHVVAHLRAMWGHDPQFDRAWTTALRVPVIGMDALTDTLSIITPETQGTPIPTSYAGCAVRGWIIRQQRERATGLIYETAYEWPSEVDEIAPQNGKPSLGQEIGPVAIQNECS